jgi:hypothetical protein
MIRPVISDDPNLEYVHHRSRNLTGRPWSQTTNRKLGLVGLNGGRLAAVLACALGDIAMVVRTLEAPAAAVVLIKSRRVQVSLRLLLLLILLVISETHFGLSLVGINYIRFCAGDNKQQSSLVVEPVHYWKNSAAKLNQGVKSSGPVANFDDG